MIKNIVINLNKSNEIKYIIDSLRKLRNIDLKVHEGKHLAKIQVESQVENINAIREILINVILVERKFEYLVNKIHFTEISYPLCALLSSLIYFDNDEEKSKLNKLIMNTRTCSVDGVFDFAMGDIKEGWDELVDLSASLLATTHSDVDLYNVTSFMMSPRIKSDKSFFIADFERGLITDVSQGSIIELGSIFKNTDYNIINAIIRECPTEIIIEGEKSGTPLVNCMKNLAKVKII